MKTSIVVDLRIATVVFLLIAAVASVLMPLLLVQFELFSDPVTIASVSSLSVAVAGYLVTILVQRSSWMQEKEQQRIGIQAEVLQKRVSNLDAQEEKLYRVQNLLPQLRELLSHTYAIGLDDSPAQIAWKNTRNDLFNMLAELCAILPISGSCKKVLDIFHDWKGRCSEGIGSSLDCPPEYAESLDVLQKHIEEALETTKIERERFRAKLEGIIT